MTRREANRVREHTAHGHMLVEGIANSNRITNLYAPGAARLYSCSCGWTGWMRPGLTNQPKLRAV